MTRGTARRVWVAALIMAAMSALAAASARAETDVYVGNIAPYSYPADHVDRGVLFDLMHEIALHVGHSGKVQVVPLQRELEIVRLNDNALCVLTRVPGREAQYTWIAPLLRERMLLVTRADLPVDISTLHAARTLRIGVLLGGPAESVVRRLGFEHVEATTSVGNNVRKLAAGRLDALVVLGGLISTEEMSWKDTALAWREGAVLESDDIYMAANPRFSPALAHAWQAAFKAPRYTQLSLPTSPFLVAS